MQHTDVELSRLLVIAQQFDIHPNILPSLINGRFSVGWGSVRILLHPLLGHQIILPTVIVFQVLRCAFFCLHCLQKLLRFISWFFKTLRWLHQVRFSHRFIQPLWTSSRPFNFYKLPFFQIIYPLHLNYLKTYISAAAGLDKVLLFGHPAVLNFIIQWLELTRAESTSVNIISFQKGWYFARLD